MKMGLTAEQPHRFPSVRESNSSSSSRKWPGGGIKIHSSVSTARVRVSNMKPKVQPPSSSSTIYQICELGTINYPLCHLDLSHYLSTTAVRFNKEV